jgi:hypothetical protein
MREEIRAIRVSVVRYSSLISWSPRHQPRKSVNGRINPRFKLSGPKAKERGAYIVVPTAGLSRNSKWTKPQQQRISSAANKHETSKPGKFAASRAGIFQSPDGIPHERGGVCLVPAKRARRRAGCGFPRHLPATSAQAADANPTRLIPPRQSLPARSCSEVRGPVAPLNIGPPNPCVERTGNGLRSRLEVVTRN